ncbi:MAG TPA: CxxC-x17-CxxC domain-containing protein [Candidatus Nanoarchaeia archaeon]|nr:CxxC-x17-CxxC domain-containing protein [Candidatus Nanoarchaeia archaeon]
MVRFQRNDHRGPRDDFTRDREPRRFSRREVTMSKAVCSACGERCEVPFRPTLSKPVYCNDCFSRKDKKPQEKQVNPSERDFDIINEKLNKIMKALGVN